MRACLLVLVGFLAQSLALAPPPARAEGGTAEYVRGNLAHSEQRFSSGRLEYLQLAAWDLAPGTTVRFACTPGRCARDTAEAVAPADKDGEKAGRVTVLRGIVDFIGLVARRRLGSDTEITITIIQPDQRTKVYTVAIPSSGLARTSKACTDPSGLPVDCITTCIASTGPNCEGAGKPLTGVGLRFTSRRLKNGKVKLANARLTNTPKGGAVLIVCLSDGCANILGVITLNRGGTAFLGGTVSTGQLSPGTTIGIRVQYEQYLRRVFILKVGRNGNVSVQASHRKPGFALGGTRPG